MVVSVAAAFQIWVIVWAPGQVKSTVQPLSAAEPEFVTVKPSWNPPDQELVTDQATLQAAPAVVVVGADDGDGDGDGDGDDVDTDGGAPLPPVSSTIDSAGTETELPLTDDVAIDGDAAE
jgi:hypothetical protein